MLVSTDRSVSVRGVLDAASRDDAGDSAVLSYIPKRRADPVPARPPALTLQAGFIPPCLPMQAPAAPSGSDWLHEIKHPGFRVIARHDGRRVRLYGRLGDDLTHRYPLIVETMARLPSCSIDGVAIACDENGEASLDLLRRRQRDDRVFLYAFDLIELGGEDLRRDTLMRRKTDLDRLLAQSAPGILPAQWIDGEQCTGASVFQQACDAGLAGIVSKRKDARYMAGRSPYWLKLENPDRAVAAEDVLGAADVGNDPAGEVITTPEYLESLRRLWQSWLHKGSSGSAVAAGGANREPLRPTH
jgi:bifunctional non-homologous end joining protein LigD